MKQNALRINGDRLWQSLMDMATIGATSNGGCNRQALTSADRQGRDLFRQWCEDAGCEVRIDDMGNLFARRSGIEANAPAIVIGSHLDTQPTGGKFDGVYGVLTGLEIVRTLNEAACPTRHPIDVVVWTNEEGTRYSPAMNGSGVWSGALSKDETYRQKDADGVTFLDALQRIGYHGPLPAAPFPIHAAFEVHIEQGPILEAEGRQIGVVTGVQGMRWYDLIATGTPAHAGTTPMANRADPARTVTHVVAGFLASIEQIDPEARATFGVFQSTPTSRNTVPQQVSVSVDLRHPDVAVLSQLVATLQARLSEQCDHDGTTGQLDLVWDCPPVAFNQACINAARRAAKRLNFTYRDIVSGAGHDSVYVSQVAPTSMIFVPCAGGLSHNEAEYATREDLTAGCDTAMHAILDIDQT